MTTSRAYRKTTKTYHNTILHRKIKSSSERFLHE